MLLSVIIIIVWFMRGYNEGNFDKFKWYRNTNKWKVNCELIQFINAFYKQTKIPLDPIYTGKMVYGVMDLIEKDFFPPNAKILMIHTGGLQGVKGMNLALQKKNKEIICYDEM